MLALLRGGRALVAHLGDCRAGLWRGGTLRWLTRDHTRARRMLQEGRISQEEAARYRSGGGLVQYLGMAGTPRPEVGVVGLLPGDLLLLCSDGLHGAVPDEILEAVLGRAAGPDSLCRDLVLAALHAGGRDNVTALALAVRQDPQDPHARDRP